MKKTKNAIWFAVYTDKLYFNENNKNEYDFEIIILYKNADETILIEKILNLISKRNKLKTDIYDDGYNTEYIYKNKYIFENNKLP